ncbi:EAL and HDOD domain-containing protein [Marinomonas pollencensis]|uniref:EAL and modified HD-GYP domain-containing signal transduction protein n=1 Tax=Marinomonas pollencensis TaxID=491954 RepID=A0A3E0DNG9_9GAMM|nr:HDOD domain-containing protein [Marinomonas pollencensis]REG84396.1 EAL and modified HD-GYP domain-containing signal transduction protein [Marinomonas pollencensis]
MVDFPHVLDDLMMAQQPIFKKSKELFGYELLFRGQDSQNANVLDGELATSQVLVNLCIGITHLETQLRKPFFINMTTDLMLSDAFFPISPETMYIEILEDQELTPEFIEAVKKWRQAGYRFALDDYHFDKEYLSLLPWVSIVKIDVLTTPPQEYLEQIKALKAKGLILVAEKVESQAMFDYCRELGFDLFQGYFLQRPEIIKGKKISSAAQSAITLVNALQDKDISIDTITNMVAQNPTLSFQLLRILKSPVSGIPKTVDSIKDAVVFLGLVQLKRWALLITLTSNSEQPKSLFKILLTRARCCQLIAELDNKEMADSAFITGVMSGIDVLFAMEKSAILGQVALSQDVMDAILKFEGPLGNYLEQTMNLEQQAWRKLQRIPHQKRAQLNRAFLDAMLWADEVLQQLN